MGRHDDAIRQMTRAREIDPLSLIISADLANVLNYARRYDDAIAACHRTLEMDPEYSPAHEFLARAYFWKGQYAEGVAEQQKHMQLSGIDPQRIAEYRKAFEQGGIQGLRRWKLAAIARDPSLKKGTSYQRAVLNAQLGARDQALDSLQEAAHERASGIEFVAVDPRLDTLRNIPRFQELLHSLGYTTKYASLPRQISSNERLPSQFVRTESESMVPPACHARAELASCTRDELREKVWP